MSNIKLFHDQQIRSHWDAEQEEWFFSVVDVVAALTDSANPTDYLKKLRKRDGQFCVLMFYWANSSSCSITCTASSP